MNGDNISPIEAELEGLSNYRAALACCTYRQVERMRSRAVRDEATGCLIFNGRLDRDGYGLVKVGDKAHREWVSAHIVEADWAYGPPPAGEEDRWQIHHLCEEPACIEPRHLLPMTRRDHMRWHLIKTHSAAGCPCCGPMLGEVA